MRGAEVQYVEELTLVRYGEWVEGQEEYRKLALEKGGKKLIVSETKFFWGKENPGIDSQGKWPPNHYISNWGQGRENYKSHTGNSKGI